MANEYLKRTPTSSGNRKVFTWAGWVKRQQDAYEIISFSSPNTVNDGLVMFGFNASGGTGIYLNFYQSSTSRVYEVDEEYRDFGSWLHYQIVVDTTQATEDDRLNLYINGVQRSLSVVSGYSAIPQNYLCDNMTAGQETLLGVGRNSSGNFAGYAKLELSDIFFVDGQALTPDVFGFYKDGKGYQSSGTSQATDFRPGQWVPKTPRIIKTEINRRGGFGVNGFYLPMNDSSNFGADFHTTPNSIITLKGENLPQPRNGAPETTDAYVSQLRTDPYAANLVLAVPGISTATGPELVTNGDFSNGTSGWTLNSATGTLSVVNGELFVEYVSTNGANCIQTITTEIGKSYKVSVTSRTATSNQPAKFSVGTAANTNDLTARIDNNDTSNKIQTASFVATSTTTYLTLGANYTSDAYFDNISVREVNIPTDYSADIKGSGSNKTLTVNGGAGIADIPSYYGSALSFDGTDDYFTVPNTADLRMGSDDFTVEAWLYAKDFTGGNGIVGLWNYAGGLNRRSWLLYTGSSNDANFIVSSDGTSAGQLVISSGNNFLTTNQWNHIVGEKEGTTIRLYVNGVVVGISTVAPSSLYENTDDTIKIGTWDAGSTEETNGYIQDVRVYKGVAKYKGGFDVPKPYAPVGIESWRAVPDCTANNFATLNPLDTANLVPFNGNLSIDQSSGGWHTLLGTHYVRSGKWYAEMRIDRLDWIFFGIDQTWLETHTRHVGGQTGSKGVGLVYNTGSRGDITYNGTNSVYTGGDATAATGDIISIALDLDSNNIKFYKNNVLQYNLTNILESGADYAFGVSPYSNVAATVNFGQNPTFSGNTTAGTYTDSNGKGLFKYQPPSGFLALCEDNLPTPAIKNPGEHFKTVLWTGDGNTRSITGIGFQPDLVWIKSRNAQLYHLLTNSVTGVDNTLSTNTTDAESFSTERVLNSFDSDGFSLNVDDGSGYYGWNVSGQNMIAWCWKAGGPAVTNTDGSITSQVSANQTAGFSIVSYTVSGTSAYTTGHGLNQAPEFIIWKSRDRDAGWSIYHKDIGNANVLRFTTAAASASGSWNSTTPTSSIVSHGGYYDGDKIIYYAWHSVEGFSKFGSYIGNDSTDGPFVYCGFKPAWVMIKAAIGVTNGWVIMDNARSSDNPNGETIFADNSNTEYTDLTYRAMDFLSNGFKIRAGVGNERNGNGATYIFAAFAESPFQTANAK